MKFCKRFFLIPLLVSLVSCHPTFTSEKYDATHYAIHQNDTLTGNKEIADEINPYRDSIHSVMSTVVGFSASAMVKGLPESNLGNFVADACQHTVSLNNEPADFTMLNLGGLRSSLPEGRITRGNIYELMPFENELVILDMSPGLMDSLFRYLALRKGNPVSGIRMKLNDSTAEQVVVGGKNFNSSQHYKMLTSDYLADGGDQLTFLKTLNKNRTGILLRDAIFKELEFYRNDTLDIRTDERITR